MLNWPNNNWIGSLLILSCLFFSFETYSEGTKEITPDTTETALMITPPGATGTGVFGAYTSFGHYSSPDSGKIYIAIKDPSTEVINLGFGDVLTEWFGAGLYDSTLAGVWWRVRAPNGTIVSLGQIPTSGVGYINDKQEANSGPFPTNGGFDPIVVNPLPGIAGDYVIEFNQTDKTIPDPPGSIAFYFKYFDFSVTDNGNLRNGRLWSYQWNMIVLEETFPYWGQCRSKFFVYTSDSVVSSMDMNSVEPRAMVVFANATGLFDTGDYFSDRKSRDGYFGYREHKIFLNDPDHDLFPSYVNPSVAFTPEVTGCPLLGWNIKIDAIKKSFAFI
ncbi:MAG: hypothetical protein MRY83_10010, partial [Flavobacteriales bacterium]|nr:hypothetical protein [Flavobacteriales bacterium]